MRELGSGDGGEIAAGVAEMMRAVEAVDRVIPWVGYIALTPFDYEPPHARRIRYRDGLFSEEHLAALEPVFSLQGASPVVPRRQPSFSWSFVDVGSRPRP